MYLTKAARELTNSGFTILTRLNSHPIISEESIFAGFFKNLGHITYCVVLINCKYEKYKDISAMVEDGVSQLPGNIVLTEVFITPKADDELLEYAKTDIEDYDSKFVNIKWIVDISDKEVKVLGEQPTKVLEIRDALEAAFENKETSPISVNSLKSMSVSIDKSTMKSRVSVSTYLIILVNTAFWLAGYIFGGETLIDNMSLNKPLLVRGDYYRIFTYMFAHGGFIHYLSNTFSLFIIGTRLEKRVGHYNFLIAYILSGIVAAIFSLIGDPLGTSVGASGAVFGVIGFMAVVAYKLKRNLDGFDIYVAIIYAVASLSTGFVLPNIDNYAHIGGLIGGILYGCFVRLNKRG